MVKKEAYMHNRLNHAALFNFSDLMVYRHCCKKSKCGLLLKFIKSGSELRQIIHNPPRWNSIAIGLILVADTMSITDINKKNS